MKKYLLAAGAVATVGLAGLTGVAAVNAETKSGSTGSDPMSGLVDAIASKFNLSKSEVQGVFDAQRSEMHAKHEQAMKDEVAQLVTDGKLTQAQADKINTKRAELEKQRQADHANGDSSMTQDERRKAMETRKAEIDTWMTDNNIDSQYVYLLMGGGRGHGHGHEMDGDRAMRDDSSSTSSTSSSSSIN